MSYQEQLAKRQAALKARRPAPPKPTPKPVSPTTLPNKDPWGNVTTPSMQDHLKSDPHGYQSVYNPNYNPVSNPTVKGPTGQVVGQRDTTTGQVNYTPDFKSTLAGSVQPTPQPSPKPAPQPLSPERQAWLDKPKTPTQNVAPIPNKDPWGNVMTPSMQDHLKSDPHGYQSFYNPSYNPISNPTIKGPAGQVVGERNTTTGQVNYTPDFKSTLAGARPDYLNDVSDIYGVPVEIGGFQAGGQWSQRQPGEIIQDSKGVPFGIVGNSGNFVQFKTPGSISIAKDPNDTQSRQTEVIYDRQGEMIGTLGDISASPELAQRYIQNYGDDQTGMITHINGEFYQIGDNMTVQPWQEPEAEFDWETWLQDQLNLTNATWQDAYDAMQAQMHDFSDVGVAQNFMAQAQSMMDAGYGNSPVGGFASASQAAEEEEDVGRPGTGSAPIMESAGGNAGSYMAALNQLLRR